MKNLQKTNNLYYPGMFDFIKGIAMISIVLTHTQNNFSPEIFHEYEIFSAMGIYQFIKEFLSFGNAAMPVFLLVSGFGFRPTKDNVKCIKKQAGLLLKPFCIVAILTTGIHFCAHYIAFRYLPGSIYATLAVGLGYLLGLSRTMVISGFTLCSIGAVWFLLMLFLSWIGLNFIITKVPEKYVPWIIFVLLIGGRFLSFAPPLPYCVVQGVIGIVYLYMGWMIKKHDWLIKKLPIWSWIIMIVLSITVAIVGNFGLSDAYWKLGYIDLIGNGCLAFIVMWIALRINRLALPLKEQICTIGRYSLWIMCIHTVEQQALPWYLIAQKWPDYLWQDFILMVIIKAILIYSGYRILLWNNQRQIRKKRERRKKRNV